MTAMFLFFLGGGLLLSGLAPSTGTGIVELLTGGPPVKLIAGLATVIFAVLLVFAGRGPRYP